LSTQAAHGCDRQTPHDIELINLKRGPSQNHLYFYVKGFGHLIPHGQGGEILRICPGDWSEQEVSEFERVLQLAGLTIEINYGLTDEGDPWCIISRTGSDKVLAHFARIDRTYIGSWEGSGDIRSGDCLRDVLDRFVNRVRL
jgi:hypothetical protein